MLIGLISDTHGLLRPEALTRLKGSELIIHAGDIGNPEILTALQEIAPVHAVRGNNDREAWAKVIPEDVDLRVADHCMYVIHDIHEMQFDPAKERYDVVISGHSHRPRIDRRGSVLFVNPGSAGPRRFHLPVCIGKLHISGKALHPELIDITAEVLNATGAHRSGRER